METFAFLNSLEQLKTDIGNQFKDLLKANLQKEIVILGTGEVGNFCFANICNIGLKKNIVSFCCSNEVENNATLHGIPLLTARDAVKKFPKAIYIIASSFQYQILEYIKQQHFDIQILTIFSKVLFFKHWISDCNNQHLEYQNSKICFDASWLELYSKLGKAKTDSMLEEVLPLLADEESKTVIKNRVNFFQTGKVQFIDNTPLNPHEYFCEDYYHLTDEEVFLDCGAFVGDTALVFSQIKNEKYKKIISFEPATDTYKQLQKNTKTLHDIECVKAGTGSSNCKLYFRDIDGGPGAQVLTEDDFKHLNQAEKEHTYSIDIVKLDNYFEEKPTFIKLDIEGSELDTLKGAQKLITTYKPKLAVCIYHKPLDFYEITKFLHELVPEYKLKVRQHAYALNECVLYASV